MEETLKELQVPMEKSVEELEGNCLLCPLLQSALSEQCC